MRGKPVRHFPDDELSKPVKSFADTFSAQEVIMRGFFAQLTPEQQRAALEYRGEDC